MGGVSLEIGAGQIELMTDEQLAAQPPGDCCALCGTRLRDVAERRRRELIEATWNAYLEGVDYDPGAVGL
jgi:hypothetical protein